MLGNRPVSVCSGTTTQPQHDEHTVAAAVQSTTPAELYPTALAVQLSHHLGSTVAFSNQQPDYLTSNRVNATFESTKGTTYIFK